MPWEDFAKTRQITDVIGSCYEIKGHTLVITGTEVKPEVVCNTPGCAMYCGVHFDALTTPEKITGTLSALGVKCTFEITYEAGEPGQVGRIVCTVTNQHSSGTTGSWTANDPGQGNGDGDEPPHHRP